MEEVPCDFMKILSAISLNSSGLLSDWLQSCFRYTKSCSTVLQYLWPGAKFQLAVDLWLIYCLSVTRCTHSMWAVEDKMKHYYVCAALCKAVVNSYEKFIQVP